MKETLRRALRTFVQAALGCIAADLAAAAAGIARGEGAREIVVVLAASAVAAGIAAVMNLPKKDNKEDKDG